MSTDIFHIDVVSCGWPVQEHLEKKIACWSSFEIEKDFEERHHEEVLMSCRKEVMHSVLSCGLY